MIRKRALASFVIVAALWPSPSPAQPAQAVFRWAGDPEGGAPYVEASPTDPNALVGYDVDVHPYSDLVLGRVDGVLLDNVLADRRKKSVPGYTVQPESVATSHYVGVLSAGNKALRDSIDDILRGAMRDGTLEKILRKW